MTWLLLRSAPWVFLLLLVSRAVAEGEGEADLLPVELAKSNFTQYFKEQNQDRWVLLEFYAHWCGACRQFKPEYEKVAAFFARRGELQPKVVVARLDCANELDICGRFKVQAYPSMRLGVAADFAAENIDNLTPIEPAWRYLKNVVELIEKHLDVKFREGELDAITTQAAGAGEGGAQHAAHPPSSIRREPRQADLNDVEGATVKSWEYMMSSPVLLEGLEARQALQDWLDLLQAYHPVPRCQKGAKAIWRKLDELWPAGDPRPAPTLPSTHICPRSQFKDWRSCKGSQPDTRGYSCGLWLLIHSLGARLPEEGNAGAVWMMSVRGFVKHFFQCSDCSKHYVHYASTGEAIAVQSKRDAVLWVWVAHNKVNGRLARRDEEDPSTADKEWPHLIWPTAQQCLRCRKSEKLTGPKGDIPDWDKEEVYQFLLRYYGGRGDGGGAAAAREELGLRGLLAKRTKGASWVEAVVVCVAVGAVVYLFLKGSTQYRLRKSESRLL